MGIAQCIPPKTLMGYGAFLRMWDLAAEEWTVLAGTSDLALPTIMREYIETNDDDGDGTVHRQAVPQTDVGDVTYTLDFIEAQYVKLFNIFNQNPSFQTCWQIVLNTPQQRFFEWCGGMRELSAAIPKKDKVTSDLTITHTGGGMRTGTLVE